MELNLPSSSKIRSGEEVLRVLRTIIIIIIRFLFLFLFSICPSCKRSNVSPHSSRERRLRHGCTAGDR